MRIFIVVALLILTGCGNSNGNPFVNKDRSDHNSVEMAKIESELEREKIRSDSKQHIASIELEKSQVAATTKQNIAKIKKEQSIELGKIQSHTELSKAQINKEVALEEVKNDKISLQNTQKTSTLILSIIAIALLLLFIYLFYTSSNNRKERLRKHENELMLKLQLKEQEVKMKMAEKVLDSITSGSLTQEQESRLIQTLETATTKLITKH